MHQPDGVRTGWLHEKISQADFECVHLGYGVYNYTPTEYSLHIRESSMYESLGTEIYLKQKIYSKKKFCTWDFRSTYNILNNSCLPINHKSFTAVRKMKIKKL